MLGYDVRDKDLEISQVAEPTSPGFQKLSAALLDLEIVFVIAVSVAVAVRVIIRALTSSGLFVLNSHSIVIATGVLSVHQ
jgi:hypothetical protein